MGQKREQKWGSLFLSCLSYRKSFVASHGSRSKRKDPPTKTHLTSFLQVLRRTKHHSQIPVWLPVPGVSRSVSKCKNITLNILVIAFEYVYWRPGRSIYISNVGFSFLGHYMSEHRHECIFHSYPYLQYVQPTTFTVKKKIRKMNTAYQKLPHCDRSNKIKRLCVCVCK
jgi:hypothetical protein